MCIFDTARGLIANVHAHMRGAAIHETYRRAMKKYFVTQVTIMVAIINAKVILPNLRMRSLLASYAAASSSVKGSISHGSM